MATMAQINSAAKRSDAFIKGKQKKHKEMIIGAVKDLQDTILDLGRQLTITPDGIIEGPIQNWQKAQSIHQSIIKEFGDQFDSTAKKIVKDFDTANADVKSNFKTVGEIAKFTGVNKEMFSALRDGYYQDYLAVSKATQQKITKALYDHVVGSSSFSSLETSIRSALMGSNAVSALGRPLSTYSKLYARDMIMNYHNDVMQTKARDLGMEYFKYIGTIMSRSRKFCRQRVGKVFSKEEIMSWNYKWAGKSGPPLVYRGGYNCRHHWQPVRKEWLPEKTQDEIDTLNKLDKDGNVIKGQLVKPKPKVKVKPKAVTMKGQLDGSAETNINYSSSMGLEQATKWSQNSAYTDTLYHGSNKLKAIAEDGFNLDKKVSIGRVYGNAVYLSPQKRIAARYAGPLEGGEVGNFKVNVKKALIIQDEEHWYDLMDAAEKKGLSFLGSEGPENVKKYFTDLGFDAIDVTNYERLGGFVVFDPKNIVMIN